MTEKTCDWCKRTFPWAPRQNPSVCPGCITAYRKGLGVKA